MSPTAGDDSIAPCESPAGMPPAPNACWPERIGSGSPRTGQPGSALPSRRSAWTVPSEVPKTSSLRLSPSRSASAGDDAPSVGSFFGQPSSVSASRWR
jgi:hypothetical protein